MYRATTYKWGVWEKPVDLKMARRVRKELEGHLRQLAEMFQEDQAEFEQVLKHQITRQTLITLLQMLDKYLTDEVKSSSHFLEEISDHLCAKLFQADKDLFMLSTVVGIAELEISLQKPYLCFLDSVPENSEEGREPLRRWQDLSRDSDGDRSIPFPLDTEDWKNVFEYAVPSYAVGHDSDKIGRSGFTRQDVWEIIFLEEGIADGDEWLGVFQLKDGRFSCIRAGCCYTGWSCHAQGDSQVSGTLEDIIGFGLTAPERERIGEERIAKALFKNPSPPDWKEESEEVLFE